jgi:hypothetical protein
MPPPPKQLDGANVLAWTADLYNARPTARTTHRVAGDVLAPAAALAICQYDGDSQFYLFYCDDEWNVCTDTCHSSIDEAKHQAEFEYEGVSALWRPAAA